ncbi:MAG: DNA adenine methylase [Pirellulales bacterium]
MKAKIVNVASVPQRSPFRYPGGKTWLIPYIREWIKTFQAKPTHFVEPFLGGGIVSLTVGFEGLASTIEMSELDEDVAAVWHCILEGDGRWLAKRILAFNISVETVKEQLSNRSTSTRQRAFNTILRNRTFHGGILAHGSSMLKNGENGKGISSRWYPQTLSDRILAIDAIKERFNFVQGDGIELLRRYTGKKDCVAFIDPPYTAGKNGKRAGRRLYKYFALDHAELFKVAGSLAGDFLMTYDNDDEVRDMANEFGFDTELVPMKNTHHARVLELLIGRDLNWARRFLSPAKQKSLFDRG